jgi:hypothetical protein
LGLAGALACGGTGGSRDDPPPADSGAAVLECVRGDPEPLFASGAEFRREGPLEARERAAAGGPIQLDVQHSGCAHYVLNFVFTWPSGAVPERSVALRAAAALLETLTPVESAGSIVRGVAGAMREMAADPALTFLSISEMETVSVGDSEPGTLRVVYDVAL